jgi:hypothetical protein
MRKDVREFIRRLESVGLTVESTPGHYRVLRDGKPLRKQNGMPFTLPFSPDTIRWRRAASSSCANSASTSKQEPLIPTALPAQRCGFAAAFSAAGPIQVLLVRVMMAVSRTR